jgi:outer membrane receptor protein involved in Fe transport
MNRKTAWLLSAGLVALASQASGQSTSQSNTDTDKGSAQPTQGATSEAAAVQDQAREQQPVDTGDIVVTATRRNQALSDVPMAVSAITAQQLQYTGATDIRQLNQVSPSLLVSSTTSEGGAAVARIRGIGTVGDNPGLEGSVGVFIDGVYRARAGMALTDLGPLDRIEVLRGPQGTLFGRNTSAGLISIITAKPLFTPEVLGQLDIGNYNSWRAQASVTGPISSTVAARLDGVWMKRDGFLKDVVSGRRVNDRDRWMTRGQVLFQPNDAFSFRLIGDYTKRNEECCAAVYLPTFDTVATGGGGTTRQPSTIAAIERGLGGIIIDDPSERKVSITPGRNYNSDVKDWGVSGEGVYDFGWAELTSITAYRYNKYTRGQDADFNNLDLLFRASDGGSFNRFKTFSQELRLQGNAFGNKLDWLVGGYYANEKLGVDDNISYGADYNRFANCLVAANFASAAGASSLVAPGVSPTCFNPPVATGIRNALLGQFNAALAGGNLPLAQAIGGQITALGAFARLDNTALSPALPSVNFSTAPFTNSGFTNAALLLGQPGLSISGTGLDDSWRQTSKDWALFTHNIFSITDQLKLTVGARYTHEKKTLNGNLTDNITICPVLSASPFASLQQLPCVIPGIPGGALNIDDQRTENKLSGTAVLSFKPTDRLLTYASYSRGYKAGGFNLDRSALFRANSAQGNPPLSGSGSICVSPTQLGCGGVLASGNDLEFKPETNDALELGAKYNGGWIDVNLALFHQLFSDFQLNTFNGLNFIVENINSCDKNLNGGDTDNDPRTGACTGDTRAGVKNTGFELEAFTRPMRDLAVNAGVTMANAKYRDNLVGANGKPLSPALFQLAGRQISNAPKWTMTGSVAWTPPIGGSGLRGLVYADVRYMSHFNTGSDLDIEKAQDAFAVVNGRIGLTGRDQRWAVEFWAQNLFDKNYVQVAFDSPVQGTPGSTTRAVEAGFFSRATQIYNAFLGEPRTFGVTLRGKLGFNRPAPPAYVPPPAPPPVEQPAPPAPPPPPPPPPPTERG